MLRFAASKTFFSTSHSSTTSRSSTIAHPSPYARVTSRLLRPTSPPPSPPTLLSQPALATNLAAIDTFLTTSCKSPPVLLTGAGISVDSGIPDYRGSNGSYYTNHKPLTHSEYVTSPPLRRRYWARSLVGYSRFASATPNAAHKAMKSLQDAGRIGLCITQNVDGLHQEAGMAEVVNLHGCGHDMVCLECGEKSTRAAFHGRLREANPTFVEAISLIEGRGESQLRPDGDADLSGVSVSSLDIGRCESCEDGMLKPDVVFFGAQVPKDTVQVSAGSSTSISRRPIISSWPFITDPPPLFLSLSS